MDASAFFAAGAFALACAALLPFLHGARRRATLDLIQKELEIERDARVAQERRCTVEIAELRGQIAVTNERFAVVIAGEVLRVMREKGVLP